MEDAVEVAESADLWLTAAKRVQTRIPPLKLRRVVLQLTLKTTLKIEAGRTIDLRH